MAKKKSTYGSIMSEGVPQTTPLNSQQIKNNAGGYSYEITEFEQLQRFVTIGTIGGTYYVDQNSLTRTNVDSVIKAIKKDGVKAVQIITDIDVQGRAVKKSSALYALALAIKHGDNETRQEAYRSINKIARTGSHLFELLQTLNDVGKGWGRGLKNAVANWYTDKTDDSLSYQVIKYRQRNGWTHRDVLRQAHPKSDSKVLTYLVKQGDVENYPTRMIEAYETVKKLDFTNKSDKSKGITLIREHRLPWETLPTQALNDPDVWKAFIDSGMPITALMRNLGKMSSIGVFNQEANTRTVVETLTNQEAVVKARVHPVNVLFASITYNNGHGTKGSLNWDVNFNVANALDKLFMLSFRNIPKNNLRTLVAIDGSGSMTCYNVNDVPLTTIAACMAMVHTEANPYTKTITYDTKVHKEIKVVGEPIQSLRRQVNFNGGGTDIACPITHAMSMVEKPEVIINYTDYETWAGNYHIEQVWEKYRRMVPNAKLIIVAMTANNIRAFSSPTCEGVLEICGFDPTVPQVIHEFITGGNNSTNVQVEDED